VPRTRDGAPDLTALAPRAADGKPDFSGMWLTADAAPCAQRTSVGFLTCGSELPMSRFGIEIGAGVAGGLPYRPAAAALVQKRKTDLSKDDPHARCLPDTFIRSYGLPHIQKYVHVPGLLNKDDEALLASADAAIAAAVAAMDVQLLHEAVGAIWEVVGEANRYFAAQEPWALKKTDFKRMETVLYVTAEIIRRLAIPALAFVPESAARMLDFLGVAREQRRLSFADDSGKLTPGTLLPTPEPVFKRFERIKPE